LHPKITHGVLDILIRNTSFKMEISKLANQRGSKVRLWGPSFSWGVQGKWRKKLFRQERSPPGGLISGVKEWEPKRKNYR
jgi:hypothetical protein